MFRAYFDDSETHTGGTTGPSRVVVVGGLVAKDEQWDAFRETWNSILARNNLPFFRMSKFAAGYGHYASMSDGERRVLLDQLLLSITSRVALVIGVGVLKADYDEVLTVTQKKRYGQPYGLAAQFCWGGIRIWADENNYSDPIPFVLESGTDYRGQIFKAFNQYVHHPEMTTLYRLHSLVMGDKLDFPELQAADIVAYNTYKLVDHLLAGGPRPSKWLDLISDRLEMVPHKHGIYDRNMLRLEVTRADEAIGLGVSLF